jgi:putative membrane protein
MNWDSLAIGVLDTVIYSLVGIIMMGIGFMIVKLVTPFSIKKEIEDDQNIALGIIIGAVIIGIAIIIGFVISSPTNTGSNPVKKIESKIEK